MSDIKDPEVPESTVTPEGPYPLPSPEPDITPSTSSVYSNAWKERIAPFATEVEKSIDEITNALTPLVGNPGDKALKLLSDEAATPDTDLREAFASLKIPKAVLNASLHLLRGPKSASTTLTAVTTSMTSLLPVVPDNTSFLQSLKIQGDLKVDPTKVYALVKAALAQKAGLYGVLKKVVELMEEVAKNLDTPCSPMYYKLRTRLKQKNYSEVLEAFELHSSYVTDDRKERLFNKLPDLWQALGEFHIRLCHWGQTYLRNAFMQNNNIGMHTPNFIPGLPSLTPATALPLPDTSGLRDQAEVVIDAVNKVFAGDSLPIVNALAYEATQIGEALSDTNLPLLTGTMTREHMLRTLGVGTTTNDIRQEQNITQYIAAILHIPNITAGQFEVSYFTEMWQLGNTSFPEIARKADEQLNPSPVKQLPGRPF